MLQPRLRRASRAPAPYPLGAIPREAIVAVARELTFIRCTQAAPVLEGRDWERIFAKAIGAEWCPSNIGLDDVQRGNCCWGAKTVKAGAAPWEKRRVRLISGRNSLDYSFGESNPRGMQPAEVGERVLSIWNRRVDDVGSRFSECRTVVLLKSTDFDAFAAFEVPTLRYDAAQYTWSWNRRGNLEGHDAAGAHRFTWQPHGAQFTVVEDVPPGRIAFRLVRRPPLLTADYVLSKIGFDNSWVEIL